MKNIATAASTIGNHKLISPTSAMTVLPRIVLMSKASGLVRHSSLVNSTACAFKSSRSANSSVEMCVASRITGGAKPASSACVQRWAQRHQRSPGFTPGKLVSRYRRAKIVANLFGEFQKISRRLHANRVNSNIVAAGAATTVAVEAGKRIPRAGL